jgi:hypothetical protein
MFLIKAVLRGGLFHVIAMAKAEVIVMEGKK